VNMNPHIECIEDMTFAEAQPDGTTLRVIVTNVDLGRVSVRYERDIVSHSGSHGVIYDVEDAGMDVFDEETVDDMVANGTWVIVARPAVAPDGDDS
jgi:hypothetical protein